MTTGGARRKLLVVSNRAPVTYERGPDGERVARRGGGGLVTALSGLLAHHDVTWIASAMSDEDRTVGAVEETTRDGSPYRLRLVPHEPEAYDRYYNVVANPTLWFLHHGLWGLGDAPDFDPARHAAWDDGYATVNAAFAAATLEELEREPDAAVFFHDYHLYLAPALVRARRPETVTSQFLHVPWPQSEAWSVLPEPYRRAVHEGLLANDVVGFHTERWRRHFLESCSDVLGAEVDAAAGTVSHAGRTTAVTAHPIGIDPDEFAGLRDDPAVLEREREIEAARPERLVLRVDRTDPSKNVVRGFRAFGLLLERHPELRGRVTMLALLDPSRQAIPEYAAYAEAIERAARAVNERFGAAGWTPVDLRVADDFAQSVAGYKQFDVLLVNAVYDGLNLVAKEGAIVNGRAGALVLSENAGVHEELAPWVESVNPFDVSGQAEALHAALTLPEEERRRRLDAIRAHVREHDIAAWTDAQLADLDRAAARR